MLPGGCAGEEREIVTELKESRFDYRKTTGDYLKAWDGYLLFPPEIEWKDKPPEPSYWMHQLPRDPKPRARWGDASNGNEETT